MITAALLLPPPPPNPQGCAYNLGSGVGAEQCAQFKDNWTLWNATWGKQVTLARADQAAFIAVLGGPALLLDTANTYLLMPAASIVRMRRDTRAARPAVWVASVACVISLEVSGWHGCREHAALWPVTQRLCLQLQRSAACLSLHRTTSRCASHWPLAASPYQPLTPTPNALQIATSM